LPHEISPFNSDQTLAILQELADSISQKIILSTISIAKHAQQLSSENDLPLSSTYKKIRKLCALKLLCIDKIWIDDSGKKVIFYKSKIRACQFSLRQEGIALQFEKNEAPCIIEGIRAR